MKKLCLLVILSMVPMLALAQDDSLANSPDQDKVQIQVSNGCVTLTPNSRDFGMQPVDFPTASKPFYLLNSCTVNLTITNITAQSSAFTQSNHIGGSQVPCNTGAPLPPNEYCEIDVVFDPPSAGSFGNNLVITYYKDHNPQPLQISAGLSGTGIHDLTFVPTSCNFGEVPRGQEAYCIVTMQNQEPQPITIDRCQVSPVPPFSQDTACPVSLATKGTQGDHIDITLEFSPVTIGVFTGQFAVTTDSPEHVRYTVPLTGVGVLCPPSGCQQ